MTCNINTNTSRREKGGAVFEFIFRISNYITLYALNDGFTVLFAHLICGQNGFTLAAAGFLSCSDVGKLSFCNRLPLKSRYRTFFSRISWVFLSGRVFLILPAIVATTLIPTAINVSNDITSCVFASQEGTISDRRYLVLNTESGVAEFAFAR